MAPKPKDYDPTQTVQVRFYAPNRSWHYMLKRIALEERTSVSELVVEILEEAYPHLKKERERLD